MDSFPAASELIDQLMTAMIAGVRNNPILRHKLFEIDYLTRYAIKRLFPCCTIKSWMMSGVSRREALRDALRAQNLNVHLIGRATKTENRAGSGLVDERLPIAGKEMITVR
ncbi:hypothetical protein ACNKHM_10740 [Shigella sonnei]